MASPVALLADIGMWFVIVLRFAAITVHQK